MDFGAAVQGTQARILTLGWLRQHRIRLRPTGLYTINGLREQAALRREYVAAPHIAALQALAATAALDPLPQLGARHLAAVLKAGQAYQLETRRQAASAETDLGLLAARLLYFYKSGDWWNMPIFLLEAHTAAVGVIVKEQEPRGSGTGRRHVQRMEGPEGFAAGLQAMQELADGH